MHPTFAVTDPRMRLQQWDREATMYEQRFNEKLPDALRRSVYQTKISPTELQQHLLLCADKFPSAIEIADEIERYCDVREEHDQAMGVAPEAGFIGAVTEKRPREPKGKGKDKGKEKSKGKDSKGKEKARKARIRKARATKALAKILLGRKRYASEASAIGVGASATRRPHVGSRVHMTTGQSTMDSHGRQAAAAAVDQKPKLPSAKTIQTRERGQVMQILWLSLQTFLRSSSSQ